MYHCSFINLRPHRWSGGLLQSFCLSVCLFLYLSVGKLPANLQTLALWKYYQQTSNHTRIKSNNKLKPLLLKPFCFKVMTIFVTHGHCFTIFRRRLVAKEFTETQLILLETYHCRLTAWNELLSSGCYNFKLALSFLPWLAISSPTHYFIHKIEAVFKSGF